ncbi:MAG: hypothetical protein MJ252_19265 [archaeon]|nr:hypothetical protein [archaeon]
MRHYTEYRNQGFNSSLRIRRKLKVRKPMSYNGINIENFPRSLTYKDMLYRYEYFGQYGNVIKIEIIPNNDLSSNLNVSFSKPSEASLALLALNDFSINGMKLKAKFDAPLQREKLYNRTNLRYKLDENKLNKDYQLMAIKLADIFNKNVQQYILKQCMNKRTVFPSPLSIYYKNKLILESGNSPLLKSKTNKTNRSRFDFVMDDEKEDVYQNEREEKKEETPKFISYFIQRSYELSYGIKGEIKKEFNFPLLCESFYKKSAKNYQSFSGGPILKDTKAEYEKGKEWFDFVLEPLSEENKSFYKNIYEENPIFVDNWATLDSPRKEENETEFLKDFDEISEGIRLQLSTEESEYSEN